MMGPFTTVVEREGDGYVARCPEVAVASQGYSHDEAHRNLKEALTLFLETASPVEVAERLDRGNA